MQDIEIIVARSLNRVIGDGMHIPWKVKGEQKLFREITTGGTLIMGRTTYESVGRPLPNRKTIVLTRSKYFNAEGCIMVNDIGEALRAAAKLGKPIYVCGGDHVYRQFMCLADVIHMTVINTTVEGDKYFSSLTNIDFNLVEQKEYTSNIDYTYEKYVRNNGA